MVGALPSSVPSQSMYASGSCSGRPSYRQDFTKNMGIEFSTGANEALCIIESRTRDTGSFFAVVIGITDYFNKEELTPLRGAVNDARAIEKYLLDDLHVPRSNIVFLENENATRDNILATIQSHLKDNPSILDHGDTTMLVFFAGHGSRTNAPESIVAPDGQIEAICPVDERTFNAAGEYVHAIPDYVLRRLLGDSSAKKGSKIIVIFDCCHSGGMDRDVERARNAGSDSCCIPLDLDSHLWKGKRHAVSHRMWSKSTTPYVVLAACRADEKARELKYQDGYRGRFTTSLISLLQWAPLKTITSAELMSHMSKWSGQVPHCRGTRRKRTIFGGTYPETGPRSVLLTPQKPYAPCRFNSSQLFRAEIGALEGVLLGTEFLAYDPNTNSVLCILVAQSVQVDHTILVGRDEPPVNIPRWSRAVVFNWKSPPCLIHTRDDFPHAAVLFPETQATFLPAPSLEEAHIVVLSDNDHIVIKQCTRMMLKVQPASRFELNGNAAHLPKVIAGIAHFNYFLTSKNETHPLTAFGLELHRLQGVYPARKPLGENMVKDGEVRLTSEVGAEYGFTIRNDSCYDLFPCLFYFDLETKTIQPWYLPASAHVDPPLPSGGTVTLGMGSDRAFEFTLSHDELSSVGFLKLFVTDKYIDLEWMQQELSPFDHRFEGTGRLRMSDESLNFMSTRWDALTVPLTVTAQPSVAPDSPSTVLTLAPHSATRSPRSDTPSGSGSTFSTSYDTCMLFPPLGSIFPLCIFP